jgi:hypothetical protein
MDSQTTYKPSHEEWLRWANVVIDRLTTCVHTYSRPPYEEIFMADQERQMKNAAAVNLLHRVHALTEDSDTPTDSLTDVAHHDERVIAGLALLMKETLDQLPALSTDMQMLLKSPWFDKCAGRLANELFRGPMNNEIEGIGSGHPEHGRLPEALQNLLEREMIGDTRKPRQELHRHRPESDSTIQAGAEPQRLDGNRRWADKSNRIRTAGQVE